MNYVGKIVYVPKEHAGWDPGYYIVRKQDFDFVYLHKETSSYWLDRGFEFASKLNIMTIENSIDSGRAVLL